MPSASIRSLSQSTVAHFSTYYSRSLLRPSFQTVLDIVSKTFAAQMGRTIANNPNLSAVLSTSPQTITSPISYTIVNLAPFDEPVYVFFAIRSFFSLLTSVFLSRATAVTFIGLLYQTILSFFVVVRVLAVLLFHGSDAVYLLR